MNRILIVALSLLLSIFPFGCDDKKEDEPSDCAPIAGEVLEAGEEPVAGEEPDMEMPEAGEMAEAGMEMDMEMPEEEPEAGAEG